MEGRKKFFKLLKGFEISTSNPERLWLSKPGNSFVRPRLPPSTWDRWSTLHTCCPVLSRDPPNGSVGPSDGAGPFAHRDRRSRAVFTCSRSGASGTSVTIHTVHVHVALWPLKGASKTWPSRKAMTIFSKQASITPVFCLRNTFRGFFSLLSG